MSYPTEVMEVLDRRTTKAHLCQVFRQIGWLVIAFVFASMTFPTLINGNLGRYGPFVGLSFGLIWFSIAYWPVRYREGTYLHKVIIEGDETQYMIQDRHMNVHNLGTDTARYLSPTLKQAIEDAGRWPYHPILVTHDLKPQVVLTIPCKFVKGVEAVEVTFASFVIPYIEKTILKHGLYGVPLQIVFEYVVGYIVQDLMISYKASEVSMPADVLLRKVFRSPEIIDYLRDFSYTAEDIKVIPNTPESAKQS